MVTKTFLKHRKSLIAKNAAKRAEYEARRVSNVAAQRAAGIDPVNFDYSVSDTKSGKDFGGKLAVNRNAEIAAAPEERGTLGYATSEADSSRPWMARNVAEEQGFNPDLYECCAETDLEDNGTRFGNTGSPSPYDSKVSAREIALAEQVAVLTERLSKAENMNASPKENVPAMRFSTPLLEYVLVVQERFFGDNWVPDDKDTHATQEDIIEWLMAKPRCLSHRRALAVALVSTSK
ncbi:hypothetical protein ACFU5E_14700 [Aeromonas bestiarum]|uniref:hypothetical protein n=1 Tax=Aeromonas TaxID=642 RepID=UPI003670FD99